MLRGLIRSLSRTPTLIDLTRLQTPLLSSVPLLRASACPLFLRIAKMAASSQSSSHAGSPFYISTAINYANGPPHMGHAYEAIVADCVARYHRHFGRDVFFLTGAD